MSNQVTKSTNTNVAIKKDIRDILSAQKNEIARALPKHMDPDRMIRVMLTAINTTPKLMNCTKESLLSALMKCSQYGLEPDGRHAHLIPYGDQCQLIFDYKGLVNLTRRSGDVADIHCDVVYEKDDFTFGFGTGGGLVHKPNLKEQDRGEITCAYSFVKLKDGSTSYEVMARWEIENVMKKSQGYKSAKQYNKTSVWEEHFPEMAKKTVFRRHSKWLPLSFEVSEAIHGDDDLLSLDEKRFATAKRVDTSAQTMLEAPEPVVVPPSDEAWIPDGTIPANTPTHLSEQEKLFQFAESEGFTRLEFCQWARNEGHIKTIPENFSDFPEDIAKRLNKAQTGLVNKLKEFKAEVGA